MRRLPDCYKKSLRLRLCLRLKLSLTTPCFESGQHSCWQATQQSLMNYAWAEIVEGPLGSFQVLSILSGLRQKTRNIVVSFVISLHFCLF